MADGSFQRAAELLKDVVTDAPDFAEGHAQLAFALRDAAGSGPQDIQAAAIAGARAHAERALVLDPHLGAPYSLIANATPTLAWAERERWLLKGIAADPQNVSLSRDYGHLLRQVGRTQDAIAQLRQAASVELFERTAHQQLALALAAAGRRDEGAAILREAERLWPDAFALKRDKFIFAMDTASFSDALRQLDDPVFSDSLFPPEGVAATRTVLLAAQSGDARRKRETIAVVTTAADHRAVPAPIVMLFLATLGDLDGAFAQGERVADEPELQRPYAYTSLSLSPLFLPGSAAMRQDPRFMPLVAKFGLVDYWRSSGRWPDFCSEPGLPYDCKAEAARLAARHG